MLSAMTTNEPPPYPGDPNPAANDPQAPPPPAGEPPSYGSAPPPPGSYPPPPGGSYPPPPPGGYHPAPGGYGPAPESNTKAIWSMITGIVSLLCCGVVLGPVAIVLSNQAKTEIAYSRGMQTGEGMATAGLILGILGIIGWVLLIIVRLSQV